LRGSLASLAGSKMPPMPRVEFSRNRPSDCPVEIAAQRQAITGVEVDDAF